MEMSMNSNGGASFYLDALHMGQTGGTASSNEQLTSTSCFMKKELSSNEKHLQVFQCILHDKAPFPLVITAPSHLACLGCTMDKTHTEIKRKMRKIQPNAMLPIQPRCSPSLRVILDCSACPSSLKKWCLTFLKFRKYHSTFQHK